MARKKKETVVSAERAKMSIMTRFDPIPTLTPARLVAAHSAFRRGYLQQAAIIWEDIAETDDKLICVKPKREAAPARYGYDFVFNDGEEDSARAKQHKDSLAYFYDNLICTSALDRNERGGTKMLIRQMMRAIGHKYACHDFFFIPRPEGLTGQFTFVPLWFFENTTGRLRFLESDYALYGVDLAPGEWLLTVGEGLMRASAIAYMFKHLPLKDWLIYCEKQAVPGLHGKTTAAKDSAEWNELLDALTNFGIDMSILTNENASITPIDVSQKGTLAYPQLIDRCDRALSSIWRGGDLSTMSAQDGEGTGASLQGEESDILEQSDAEMLTDTLNEQVDRFVIQNVFGEEPLAWIRIKTGQKQDVKQDIEIDRFMLESGMPVSAEQLAARYGRTLPADGETILTPPQKVLAAASESPPGYRPPGPMQMRAANTAPSTGQGLADLLKEVRTNLAEAEIKTFRPVAMKLQELYDAADESAGTTIEDLLQRLKTFVEKGLPDLVKQVGGSDETVKVWTDALIKFYVAGFAGGRDA